MKSIRYTGITKDSYEQLKSDVSRLCTSEVKNAHMGLTDNLIARAIVILKECFIDGIQPLTFCHLKINAAYTISGIPEAVTVTGLVYEIIDHATASVYEILSNR